MVKIRNVSSFFLAFVFVFALQTSAFASQMLVPGGMTVGIELQSNGVVVSKLAEVVTDDGAVCPARDAGIEVGDCIIKIGSENIADGSDFIASMKKLNGEKITATILRGEEKLQVNITPVKSCDGGYQLGMWLRDGASGIGTVTYYDPVSGQYGALGHGVCDADNGLLIQSDGGTISPSVVVDVIRGANGSPGELCGMFDARENLGTIAKNTQFGIFGTMCGIENDTAAVEVAESSEVCLGACTILSNVDGEEICEYSAEICKIDNKCSDGKNMVITITDETLIAKTGGIVQGMSGSPILQNGKLIGAVTHVLVSDPCCGYGIFIENMLETAESI